MKLLKKIFPTTEIPKKFLQDRYDFYEHLKNLEGANSLMEYDFRLLVRLLVDHCSEADKPLLAEAIMEFGKDLSGIKEYYYDGGFVLRSFSYDLEFKPTEDHYYEGIENLKYTVSSLEDRIKDLENDVFERDNLIDDHLGTINDLEQEIEQIRSN